MIRDREILEIFLSKDIHFIIPVYNIILLLTDEFGLGSFHFLVIRTVQQTSDATCRLEETTFNPSVVYQEHFRRAAAEPVWFTAA